MHQQEIVLIDSKNNVPEDKLNRKDIARRYVQLIKNINTNCVIALDAPWGSGKSTLINYMCTEFDSPANKDIYIKYNAWENDYTDEPLLSLMSSILDEFVGRKYIGIDKFKTFITNMTKATKSGAKGAMSTFAKHVIGEQASQHFAEAGQALTDGFMESFTNNLFEEVNKSKKSRENFKSELSIYVNKILKEKEKDKLIIIIDELDRCRPTFAIELLENIKHIFNIKGVVFLIAVDNKQLAESIKSIYGNGFDAKTYLHRFFDFELHLKKDDLDRYFYDLLSEKYLINSSLNVKLGADFRITDFLSKSISVFSITIRDIYKIVNELHILNTLYIIHFYILYIFLLIIKHKNEKIFLFLKNSQDNFSMVTLERELLKDEDLRLYINKYLPKICQHEDKEKTKFSDMTMEAIKRIEETL